jgi:tRNA nucleotidyltransferase (CCA-adding enzyme)
MGDKPTNRDIMRIVITHHNADLDALASVMAARKLHPGAIALRGRSVSQPVHRFLALHKDIFPMEFYHAVDPEDVEEVIIVDVRDRTRLKEYEPILSRNPRMVIYDHHPNSDHDLSADEETLEPVGACATLLCERLQQDGIELTPAEATLMVLGIYADTGRLSFASTTPRDVDAVAYLMRKGANLKVVNRYLQDEYTPDQQALLLALFENISEFRVDSVDLTFTHWETDRYIAGAADVVERVMLLGGHEAIFAIIDFQKDKRIQIIGRSRVPYVDVGALLSELGGGGHAGAAAASIKGSTFDEVKASLESLVRSTSLKPARVRDLMSSPVQTIEHDVLLRDADRCLQCWGVSGVPVMRDGELKGIISRRDIERARKTDQLDIPVAGFMSHEVKSIEPDAPVDAALDMMTAADIGRLPVLDSGRLIGIVSRTDLMRRFYGG